MIVVFVNRRLIVFPLFSLLIGAIFIAITFSLKSTGNIAKSDISVLSYNVRYFRHNSSYAKFSKETLSWVAGDTSSIKCIQEFYASRSDPNWKSIKQIEEKGYYSFVFASKGGAVDNIKGLAIFSRFEILDSGFVWKNYDSINAGIFADVQVGGDTLRIYNVHLQSMELTTTSFRTTKRLDQKAKKFLMSLKDGAQKRAAQIDKIIEHCGSSPYPYIICGDFNDTPYSYNYFKLKRYFLNAFEEAGNGFGFSFNGILFFLRIDHQFYLDGVEAVDYSVDRSIKISDHFPTKGLYRLQ